jgi:hypothetical protein
MESHSALPITEIDLTIAPPIDDQIDMITEIFSFLDTYDFVYT